MAGGRAKTEEKAREAIQELKLDLMGLKIPLFSGQALQMQLAELLEKKRYPENLDFLQDMHSLSKEEDPTEGFAKIMKTYIAAGSEKQINIDSYTRTKLMIKAKENPLKLSDFIPAVNEVCLLIKTNVNSWNSTDKNSLLVACVKQLAEIFLQELNELKPAIQISIKLKSPIQESLQASLGFIKNTMIKLKALDPNNKNYAKKFTDLFGKFVKQQKAINSKLMNVSSEDKSIIVEARDIGERARESGEKLQKLMGGPRIEKNPAKGFFSSLWSGQRKVQQVLPEINALPKVAVNRYLVINNNPDSKMDKAGSKKPTVSTEPVSLPPLLIRRKNVK